MIAEHYIRDSDILTEDEQSELAALRHTLTVCYFRVGDIAQAKVIEAARNGFEVNGVAVTAERIYRAVGNYVGKSARTIRYYTETAAFYSPEEREEFDVLPFSVFVLARRYGRRYREVLEFAAERPHLSAEAVEVHFATTEEEKEAAFFEDEGTATARGNGGEVIAALAVLSSLVGARSVLLSLPLPERVSMRLSAFLEEAQAILSELVRALRQAAAR